MHQAWMWHFSQDGCCRVGCWADFRKSVFGYGSVHSSLEDGCYALVGVGVLCVWASIIHPPFLPLFVLQANLASPKRLHLPLDFLGLCRKKRKKTLRNPFQSSIIPYWKFICRTPVPEWRLNIEGTAWIVMHMNVSQLWILIHFWGGWGWQRNSEEKEPF